MGKESASPMNTVARGACTFSITYYLSSITWKDLQDVKRTH